MGGPPTGAGFVRGIGRLVRQGVVAVPCWLVAVVIAPHLPPGGTASPWNPAMPYARTMWFTGHQLISFQQVYLDADPASGMIFPLSSVGAGLATVMSLGSWFGWQLIFLAISAGALTWLVDRCTGVSGWRVALVSALVMAGTAPARAAVGQGTLDLLMLALLVAGMWPRRVARQRSALGLGLAAAVWLGPLAAVVAMIVGGRGAGGRGWAGVLRAPGRGWRVAHRGFAALGSALLLTVCALFALPWATNDFWWLARRGAAGVSTGLDPSLGARAGFPGWVIGGLVGLAGLLVVVVQLRARRPGHALVWLCVALCVAVPAQFAGQGTPALVAGILATRLAMPAIQRAALLVWAGWTCLVPLDLWAEATHGAGPVHVLLWVGPLLGVFATLLVTVMTVRERLGIRAIGLVG